MNKKISSPFAITIIVILAVIFAGAVFAYQYWWMPREEAKNQQKLVACTEEAKVCPDGSAVGRIGPNCEFAACPMVTDQTAGWETYTNNEYGFGIKYPGSFIKTTTNCYNNSDDGKINDDKSTKLTWGKEGIYVHICRYNVSYNKLSDVHSGKLTKIDSHDGYVDNFIIAGGGRAFYYIKQDDSHSLFIDAFWEYPKGNLDNSALEPKKEIVDKIVSTLKFLSPEEKLTNNPENGTKSPTNTPLSLEDAIRLVRVKDLQIQSDIGKVRPFAEMVYGDNLSYIPLCNSNNQLNTALVTPGFKYGAQIKLLAEDIVTYSGFNAKCQATKTQYCVSASLASDSSKYACVDSLGKTGVSVCFNYACPQ